MKSCSQCSHLPVCRFWLSHREPSVGSRLVAVLRARPGISPDEDTSAAVYQIAEKLMAEDCQNYMQNARCLNCQDGCFAVIECKDCWMTVCHKCWEEHNNGAPDHTKLTPLEQFERQEGV